MARAPETNDDLEKYKLLLNKQVRKRSNKPFKSGSKVNTPYGIIIHPQTGLFAFIFAEDESNVECWRCVLV